MAAARGTGAYPGKFGAGWNGGGRIFPPKQKIINIKTTEIGNIVRKICVVCYIVNFKSKYYL